MMKYKIKRYFPFLAGLMITIMLIAEYSYIWYNYYINIIDNPFYNKGNWLVLFVYAMLIYIFFNVYSGYKFGFLTTINLIYSEAISIVIVNVLTYFQLALIARRWVSVRLMFTFTGAQVSTIVIFCIIVNSIYFAIYPPRRMIILYGSNLADSLIAKMNGRKEKYKVCEAMDVNTASYDELCDKMSMYNAVVLCDIKPGLRSRILKYCFDNNIRAYLTPKIADIFIRSADNITLFDTPLLLCRNRGLRFEQRFIKRCVDLLISSIMLILASPIMLITAMCIKLYDGGPAFFKQKRSTIDGKVFEIYKFRSMIVDAEKDGKARLASENDSRITPVGKIIRSYRLDELPQLINIFKGDMSVVGPRPERPEIIEKYIREMPEFKYRLKVKAGLTGYAQVMGKYNTTAYDKLKMDLMYIENYSLFMDIKLILLTAKIMFSKESTEGVKN